MKTFWRVLLASLVMASGCSDGSPSGSDEADAPGFLAGPLDEPDESTPTSTPPIAPPPSSSTPTGEPVAPSVDDPEPDVRPVDVRATVLPDYTVDQPEMQAGDVGTRLDGTVVVGGWYRSDAGRPATAALWLMPADGAVTRVDLVDAGAESAVTSVSVATEGSVVADGWRVDVAGRARPFSWTVSLTDTPGPAMHIFGDDEDIAGLVVDSAPSGAGLVRLVETVDESGIELLVIGRDGERESLPNPPGSQVVGGQSIATVGNTVAVTGRVRRSTGEVESVMWVGSVGSFSLVEPPELSGHNLGELAVDGDGLVLAVAPNDTDELAIARSADGSTWTVDRLTSVAGDVPYWRAPRPSAPFMGAVRIFPDGGRVIVSGGPIFPHRGVVTGNTVEFRSLGDQVASDAWSLVVDGEPSSLINFERTFLVSGRGLPPSVRSDAVSVGWTQLIGAGREAVVAAATEIHTKPDGTLGAELRWSRIGADGELTGLDDSGQPRRIGIPSDARTIVRLADGSLVAIGLGAEVTSSGSNYTGDVEVWTGEIDSPTWRSEGIVYAAPGGQNPIAADAFGDGWIVVGIDQRNSADGVVRVPLVVRSDGLSVIQETVAGMESGWLDDVAVAGDVAVAAGRGGLVGEGRRFVVVRGSEGTWSPAPFDLPAGATAVGLSSDGERVAVVAPSAQSLFVGVTSDGTTFGQVEVPFPTSASVTGVEVLGDIVIVAGEDWSDGSDDLALWVVDLAAGTIDTVPLAGSASSPGLEVDGVAVTDGRLLMSGVLHGQAVVWSVAVADLVNR